MSWNLAMVKEELKENGIKIFCTNKNKWIVAAPIFEPYSEEYYDELIVKGKNTLKSGDWVEIEGKRHLIVGGSGLGTENWNPQLFEIVPEDRLVLVEVGHFKVQCNKNISDSVKKNLEQKIELIKRKDRCEQWINSNPDVVKLYRNKFVLLDPDKGIISSSENKEDAIQKFRDVLEKEKNQHYDCQLTFIPKRGKPKEPVR